MGFNSAFKKLTLKFWPIYLIFNMILDNIRNVYKLYVVKSIVKFGTMKSVRHLGA